MRLIQKHCRSMTELFFRNIKISKYFPEKMIFFIQKKIIGKQHFKKINHGF